MNSILFITTQLPKSISDNMFAVIKIYNNSVSRTFKTNDYDKGKKVIKILAENQLDRELTLDEIGTLDDTGEISFEIDHENFYTFSINQLEDFKEVDLFPHLVLGPESFGIEWLPKEVDSNDS